MSRLNGVWWDVSYNPVTGCTPISEGCANCWARAMAGSRLRGRYGYPQDKPFRVTLHPDKLHRPPSGKDKKIFVCDMGDLFHKQVPTETIEKLLGDCAVANHTFIFLTKRAGRMRNIYCEMDDRDGFYGHPNLWFGVTCENQKWADIRIPELLKIPAAVRFLSLEPLLGPIDARGALGFSYDDQETGESIPVPAVNWVVIGCESGPGRRLCKLEWIHSIVDQCRHADVPVWVKQIPKRNGYVSHDMNQWPEWARRREWPK